MDTSFLFYTKKTPYAIMINRIGTLLLQQKRANLDTIRVCSFFVCCAPEHISISLNFF